MFFFWFVEEGAPNRIWVFLRKQKKNAVQKKKIGTPFPFVDFLFPSCACEKKKRKETEIKEDENDEEKIDNLSHF